MKSDENSASIRPFGFRSPRVFTNFSFSLEVIPTGERYEAVCSDISEDGLAAEMPGALAPKTPVILRLLLPGSTMLLQIRGSIEYSDDRRCGLNFLYSCMEERQQIRMFIQSIS
jgi:hypothetical protein